MTEKIIIEIYKTRTKPRKLTMTEISEVLKKELISKIASITGTLDFDPSKPLNIERYKYKSEGEKLYEEEVEKHKNKISELQQKINDKTQIFLSVYGFPLLFSIKSSVSSLHEAILLCLVR